MNKTRLPIENWIVSLEKSGFSGLLKADEPMASHTTFKIGGPADLYSVPASDEDVFILVRFCKEQSIPIFVLGGGANLLVSDLGIRGIVADTRQLNHINIDGDSVVCGSGAEISEVAYITGRMGLSGLHGFYGMPGSVGGALYMNARCYGNEISTVFHSTLAVRLSDSEMCEIPFYKKQWAYKLSPFQSENLFLLSSRFQLNRTEAEPLISRMAEIRQDRKDKGHYRSPCAGSAFKNNRAFGKPSGQIIDEVGLRGLSVGDAAVSDWHANIIINKGSSSASDMRTLLDKVQDEVYNNTGCLLEPEIQFAGEWER